MTRPADALDEPKVNLLLVDDRPADLLALEAILADLDQNLIKAVSGEEALERLQHEDFAVVLLDVRLPGLDGFETARRIRSQERSRRTPIIFISGQDTTEFPIAQAYALGAVDYLVKPLVPLILHAKVASFVELHHQMALIQRQAEQLRQMEHAEYERRLARQGEQRERAQREQLRVTLASIGDGVIVADIHGQVIFLNPVAQQLTGWTELAAIDRPLADVFSIINEQTRQSVENPVAKVLQEGKTHELANHTLLIAQDGTERPIDDTAAPILQDGEVVGVVLVFRDCTEQRRAEEIRLHLAAIVETSDDAIIGKSLEGIIRSWNQGAERIFGYSAEEAIGQSITLLLPPERLREEEAIRARLRRGERVDHFETIRVRKDGSRIDMSVTISPIKDAEGHIIGASKIARDITAHKRLERELQERAKRLAESDRRKDEFLAMLAHELRNPLGPIRNGLHILRQPDMQSTVLERTREMMERQVQHLSRLVDDLLDVSRVLRGKVPVQRERLDLGQLVRQTAEDQRTMLEQSGLSLTLDLPGQPVWITGDPTRLTQVLCNLLDNTIKFKANGGRVSIQLRNDDERAEAVLVVRDQGMGIERDALDRIFEAFAQADRSLDRPRGGLGLGLALVKGLVELHGGHIQAASGGPRCGAEFTIRLPLKEERAAVTGKPVSTPRLPAQQLRILIIEDNQDAADSLRMVLELLGHEVQVAYTGPDGVRAADRWRPDAVLCDIGLPGLDGYCVAGELRRNPATADVRLIALTGYGQEEDRRRSREVGFDYHLVKPVDPADLQPLLARRTQPRR